MINSAKLIPLITLFLLAFTSCKRIIPTACFNASSLNINAGDSVSLDASCSLEAHQWEWNFGDTETGEGLTISHQYNNPGFYDLTLKVYNEDMSEWDQHIKTITVN